MRFSIGASLSSLPFSPRLVRLCAAVGLISLGFYICIQAIAYIEQLFELSVSEATKCIRILASLLNNPQLDVEFLPQEFVALDPTEGGVYEYAPGDHDRLLFRRSPTTRGLWEWSDDGKEWYSTDNYEQARTACPDPYAVIFLLRLHLEHLVRQRLSSRFSPVRHLPPPLDIPPDMLPPPQQLLQQQQQGQQKQKQHKGSGSAAEAVSGGAKDAAKEAGPHGRAGGGEGASRGGVGGAGGDAQQADGGGGLGPGHATRLVDSAPDVLCCPISHSLMRMPVVTPSGTTYDFECIHRWIQQNNSDPINGQPLTVTELYPNLLVRDLTERWIAQSRWRPPRGQRGDGDGGGGRGPGLGPGSEGRGGAVVGALDAGRRQEARWEDGGGGVLPPHLLDLS